MIEPIDAPIPLVRGGSWPLSVVRVELTCDRALMLTELAGASRRFRQGVVGRVDGIDCFAYPNQTVVEIAREHDRRLGLSRMEYAHREPPVGNVRWTAERKEWIILEIAAGRMTPAVAIERWAISEDEIEEWARAYQAFGLSGLRIGNRRQEADA